MRRKLELKSGTEYQLDFNEDLAMSPEAFSRQYVAPAVARSLETPEGMVRILTLTPEILRALDAIIAHDEVFITRNPNFILPREWARDPDFEDVFGLAELGGDIGVVPS